MTRIFTIFCSLLLTLGISLPARAFPTLPAHDDGTMRLFDLSSLQQIKIPDSLKVVHISYVARHGARFLSSEAKTRALRDKLIKARHNGTLTPRGEEFVALFDSVSTLTNGRWGLLSPIGHHEEAVIGKWLADNLPPYKISAASSYVPRVIQTMNDCLLPFAEAHPGLEIKTLSGEVTDSLTRFFDIYPEYEQYRQSVRKLASECELHKVGTQAAERLVGTAQESGLTPHELFTITYQMYYVLQGMRAMGLEPTTQWMDENEYLACWRYANYLKYYEYYGGDMPAQSAAKLADYISWHPGDEEGAMTAVYGHAETLLPLLARLGIGEPDADDAAAMHDGWNAGALTPLGANLLILYLRTPSGAYEARYYLNGSEVHPKAPLTL